MKKIIAGLLLVIIAVALSGCTAFNDYQERTQILTEPLTVTLNATVTQTTKFDIAQITSLRAKLQQCQEVLAADTANPLTIDQIGQPVAVNTNPIVYQIELKITGLTSHVSLTTKPWQIIRTTTITNPLTFLPTPENLDLTVALTSRVRFSTTNALAAPTVSAETGQYTYEWNPSDAIIYTETFANRPLYYLLALGIAVSVGIIVFLIARYSDCKKKQSSL